MSRNNRALTSLRFLFVTTFLGQMIMGVVGIAVPIYANLLGASPFLLGIIGTAGGLTYSFTPLVTGTLSDRLRRKAFIFTSMVSYGLSCLLYSFSKEPFGLILVKVLEWLSIATFWPALEALIADSSRDRLEEALKKFNVAWGSAMVIGPAIGGVLISGYSVEAPFLFSFIVALPLGVLSLVLVKEPPRGLETAAHSPELKDSSYPQCSILTALSSTFLFSSLGGMIFSLFPAYATNLGIPAYEVGLMMFALGAARTVTFYQAYRIEAKLRKMGMFLAGSLTLALASLLIAESYTTRSFTACFLIFGFGMGVSYAASISYILRGRGSSRGYAAGLFESLIGVGSFIGSLAGGIVSEHSLNAPYVLGFFISLVVCSVQLISLMERP